MEELEIVKQEIQNLYRIVKELQLDKDTTSTKALPQRVNYIDEHITKVSIEMQNLKSDVDSCNKKLTMCLQDITTLFTKISKIQSGSKQ